MNKISRLKSEEETRKRYTVPFGAAYQLRVRNAVYISPSNTLRHELAKTIGAYLLRKNGDIPNFSPDLKSLLTAINNEVILITRDFPKESCSFITEACPKKEPERRVDLVRLWDNARFEFESSSKVTKPEGIDGSKTITIYL